MSQLLLDMFALGLGAVCGLVFCNAVSGHMR